jgi:hypothetical protein
MKLNYTDVRISINFISQIGIEERGTGYSSATGIFLVQIACVLVKPFLLFPGLKFVDSRAELMLLMGGFLH